MPDRLGKPDEVAKRQRLLIKLEEVYRAKSHIKCSEETERQRGQRGAANERSGITMSGSIITTEGSI